MAVQMLQTRLSNSNWPFWLCVLLLSLFCGFSMFLLAPSQRLLPQTWLQLVCSRSWLFTIDACLLQRSSQTLKINEPMEVHADGELSGATYVWHGVMGPRQSLNNVLLGENSLLSFEGEHHSSTYTSFFTNTYRPKWECESSATVCICLCMCTCVVGTGAVCDGGQKAEVINEPRP